MRFLNLRNFDVWLFNVCVIFCLVLNIFLILLVFCNLLINKLLKYCFLVVYGKELSVLLIFLLLIDINFCFFDRFLVIIKNRGYFKLLIFFLFFIGMILILVLKEVKELNFLIYFFFILFLLCL